MSLRMMGRSLERFPQLSGGRRKVATLLRLLRPLEKRTQLGFVTLPA